MRNFMIEFLGGISKENYLLLNTEYNAIRENNSYLRARNEELIRSLNDSEQERKNLQNLLFVKAGIIQDERLSPVGGITNSNPIRVAPRGYRETLRAMESDDRKRASSHKGDPAV